MATGDDMGRLVAAQVDAWDLRPDGEPTRGSRSAVLPVTTSDGAPAVLKVGDPAAEPVADHLVLRRWAGSGAVRLLRADPHRGALLLERAGTPDLEGFWDVEACEIVATLYPRLHVAAMPQLPDLADLVDGWIGDLAALPRSAPIPHRLVEWAIGVGRDLVTDDATSGTVLHGDLHYRNVLSSEREPWLAIDPKPVNGDPHFEVVPMLFHRWADLEGDTRDGVRRRFFALVDAAGLSDERARDWVVLRMVRDAMWALREPEVDRAWLTTCIAVAKAVQG
nr:aminoglycoside phosphotransferase family protein [Mycolicibacterium sediminis]